MTIDTATPIKLHTIAGTGPYGTTWPYAAGTIAAFVILPAGTLHPLVAGTDYTVAPLSSDTAGNITLSAAAAATHAGRQLMLERQTIGEQGWAGTQSARERGLEAQLDQLTMALQELRARSDRSLRTADLTPVSPLVPGEDGTALIWQDGQLVPGPTADQIAAAQAAVDAVLNRVPSYYDTIAALKADTTNFADGQLLQVRDTGAVYRVKTSPALGDFLRNDGRPIEVVTLPLGTTGEAMLGGTPTADTVLAVPAFLKSRGGVVSAEAIGLKTGSGNADNNVTRMAAAAPDIVGNDISRLTFGPGSFYFSNTVANLEGSNFILEGPGRGMTSLILSADTGSHRGKFIKLGGYADVYVFTATAGQTAFVGAATTGGTLTFTVSSVLTVQVNGVNADYTVNVGTQTVTLTTPAALNDLVRIEVAASTYGRIKIRGFTISCLSGTADQNQPFFNMGAISDFDMSDIRVLANIGGFLRCGYEGTVARTTFSDINGNIDPLNTVTVWDIAQAGRLMIMRSMLTGARGAGPKLGTMIRLKPIPGATIDTVILRDSSFYCMDGVNRNMEIDMTDGSVTNVWLNNNTFDHGKINNMRIIDGGATFARWCRNFYLRDNYFRITRESPDAAARNINVDLTGSNTRLDNFNFSGTLGFGPAGAVRVSKTNAGSQVNGFRIHDTNIVHQETDAGATPVTACIDIAAEGVSIKNCKIVPAFHSSYVRVNYLARTTADVDNFEVVANDNSLCLLGDMLHTTYAAASPRRIVRDNFLPTATSYATATGTNQLGNKTHAINRAGKFAGKTVMNSTTGFPVYAAGPADTDPWKLLHDNSTLVTPA